MYKFLKEYSRDCTGPDIVLGGTIVFYATCTWQPITITLAQTTLEDRSEDKHLNFLFYFNI